MVYNRIDRRMGYQLRVVLPFGNAFCLSELKMWRQLPLHDEYVHA
jgi:hypothetical protein